MTIWDTLTGRKSSSSQQQSSPSTSAPSEPTTTFGAPPPPNPYSNTESQGVESFINPSAFADPSQLHPLACLNKESLEYLTLDDTVLSDAPGHAAIPSRGFSDDICYGTGITYVTALSVGGAQGLIEGLSKSANQAPKLRLNSTLNAITRRGPYLGNSAGVIAICYNCFSATIGWARGTHDAANTILAGTLSGMVFRSTKGMNSMLYGGAVVGSIAAAWAVTKQIIMPSPSTSEQETHL